MKAKWEKFTQAELLSIFQNSSSIKEAMQKIGYSTKGGGFYEIAKKIANIIHFDLTIYSQLEDLTKKRFGKLLVKEQDKEKSKEKHNTYWKCLCDCGKECSVKASHLKSGVTTSCGCVNKQRVRETHMIDISGQIFDNIKVIERDNTTTQQTKWICECLLCGTIFSTESYNLRKGQTKSCGCIKSKGEYKVGKILSSLELSFKKEFSFKDLLSDNKIPLRFDYAIFDNNKIKVLIECQGGQHYKPIKHFGGEITFIRQQKYDNKKRQYCKQHNIKLIEIPYWDFDKINKEYILNLIV